MDHPQHSGTLPLCLLSFHPERAYTQAHQTDRLPSARSLFSHFRRNGIHSPILVLAAPALLHIDTIWITATCNTIRHARSGTHAMDCWTEHESEFHRTFDWNRA